jgi:hypothetical protein
VVGPRVARDAGAAAELEMAVENVGVIAAPVLEELVVLEAQDRPAGLEGAAAALHLPHRERRLDRDARLAREAREDAADAVIGGGQARRQDAGAVRRCNFLGRREFFRLDAVHVLELGHQCLQAARPA